MFGKVMPLSLHASILNILGLACVTYTDSSLYAGCLAILWTIAILKNNESNDWIEEALREVALTGECSLSISQVSDYSSVFKGIAKY